MGKYLTFQLRTFRFVLLTLAAFFLAACQIQNPVPMGMTDSGSTGGTTATPRNVRVSWSASHAGDVGLTGGGYKVYVRKGSAPTTSNTTPVVVANPGGGTHVTSTTMVLTSGQYYVAVGSYSTNGDSPLSSPYILVVP